MIQVARMLRVIFSITTLDQTAIALTFPLFTLIFFDPHSRLFLPDTPLSIRTFWYGLCLSAPNLLNIFLTPVLSALSDRFGRQFLFRLELVRVMGFSLCVGFGILLANVQLVLCGLLFRGAFVRANTAALCIIGDVIPSTSKVLYISYLQFAIAIGACFGPILGGYLAQSFWFNELNFSLPFFLVTCITILNLFLLHGAIPRTHSSTVPAPKFKTVLLQPTCWYVCGLLFLIQLGWSTYYQFISPILKLEFGFGVKTIGWFMASIAFCLMFASTICMKLLNRFFSLQQVLNIAICSITAGIFMTMLASAWNEAYLAWLGIFPTAGGDVIAYCVLTALYSNYVPATMQGKIMAVIFLLVSCAWGLTGALGSFLLHLSLSGPLCFACVSCTGALFISASLRGERSNPDPART